MIKNTMIIHTAMMEALETAHQEGKIAPNKEGELLPEMLFPFSLSDVAGLHKEENGAFVFELINGELWNVDGECETTAKDSDFDTV